MAPFMWMGFNCLQATEPLRGDSLLLPGKSNGKIRPANFFVNFNQNFVINGLK